MKIERKKLFTQALNSRAGKKNQPYRARVCSKPQDDLFACSSLNIEAYLEIPTYLRRGIALEHGT